jgi:dipeptidyl aminopeptidase/acylaminoacyl peptidase
MGAFSASGAGTLVYAGVANDFLQLTWFDRAGRRVGTLGDPAGFAMMNFSPDRKSVAASVHEVSNRDNTDIWIYDVARGIRTRFTFDPAGEFKAAWSPDGATVVFDSSRKGHYDLYRKPSNGAGAEELLYADGLDKSPTSWSPDGKFLLYSTPVRNPKTGADLWILPNPLGKPGASKPYPLLQTPFNERFGLFSPNGKWIAFQSNESGRNEIYATPFPGPGAKRQISAAGGRFPRWRGDGKEVFYLAPDNRLMSADIRETAAAIEVGEIHTLFGPLQPLEEMYDVSADGQRILAMVPLGQTVPQSLTVVENWTAGLRK